VNDLLKTAHQPSNFWRFAPFLDVLDRCTSKLSNIFRTKLRGFLLKQVDTATLRNHLADVLNEVQGKKDYMLVTTEGQASFGHRDLDFLEDLLAARAASILSHREAREDARRDACRAMPKFRQTMTYEILYTSGP